MNNFKFFIIFIIVVLVIGLAFLFGRTKIGVGVSSQNNQQTQINENPLSIASMRQKNYPGSDLIIEQKLAAASNYNQYIASYQSDGLKIYGLLTVPMGPKPAGGFPVIVFNHGYLPPETYETTQRYVAYVDAFAKNGFIVFKPDFRGHGNSEGQPQSAYYSPAYATDALNALSSLKRYPEANPNKIGMWGHSMGGNITLRSVVIDSRDIKAAVIWGGVVGSYDDLMNNWQNKVHYHPAPEDLALRNKDRQQLVNTYGTPQNNPQFWQSVDPTFYLADIATPIQLHTGGDDQEVPVVFSVSLEQKLQAAGKTVEYYNYPGGDHNISSPNFERAMQRSLSFFNKYLKGGD